MPRPGIRKPGFGPAGLAGGAVGLVVLGVAAATIAVSLPNAQEKPSTKTGSCTNESCHKGIIDRPVMHLPAAQRKCLDCHEYAVPNDHLFRLTTPKRELCSGCHTLRLGPTVHEPVAQNDCIGCHDPHGSDHRMLLVADPAGGLCESCHTQNYLEKEFVHGPVAVGACVVCHEPHASSHEMLLRKGPKALCVECHVEAVPSGLAARHQHKPMEDGCTTCHDPHASDVKFQLVSTSSDLCFSCHEGVKNFVGSAAITHGPLSEPDGCVSCHTPPFTRLPDLQKTAQPGLCLACHNRPITTSTGRTLTDMAALLKDNPDHHGPIRDGACTACHQPHGSDHFGLLFLDYPAEFYAPFEMQRYQLCFSCHLGDLVQDKSGTGLTGFRDGDLNLHWLHVNQEKGRTCRACHEVHASKRPFHIREAVPYGSGGWLLEINFQSGDSGGSCAPACHKKRTYDRSRTMAPALPDAVTTNGAGL